MHGNTGEKTVGVDQGLPALLGRAKSGDADAVQELCHLYAPRLRGYLAKALSHQVLEDAIQETWVRILAAVAEDRFRDETFEGFLFAVARSVQGDVLRSAAKERKRRRGIDETWICQPQPSALESREACERIQAALRALPKSLRIPLVLRHRRGLSYKKIAALLGTSVNAIALRVQRARKHVWKDVQDSV